MVRKVESEKGEPEISIRNIKTTFGGYSTIDARFEDDDGTSATISLLGIGLKHVILTQVLLAESCVDYSNQ